ncbi:MAG: type II secretion system protein [Proteobacteria bacterium]|nr:type II secretion system protein [Pseudomonadota bacterium]
MKKQSGFTLIELVVVIVILGILAATALPKFVDLTGNAYQATAAGIGGGLSSAGAINYGACAANSNTGPKCTPFSAATNKCADVGVLLAPAVTITAGALPTPTVAKTLYITTANNIALTATGATCNAIYGDGTNAGTAFTYTAFATGP